ncbi:MAG TPA: HTH domain-containing protein [Puia sp.]|nr:HTH domain-containing protein [Puia sp.]
MKLHEAIVRVLEQKGHSMTTQEIAEELNKNKWYQKKDHSKITAFQIHGRTKNYPHLFYRNGPNVQLATLTTTKLIERKKKKIERNAPVKPSYKDEHYVLDLCDKVLGLASSRQHKFDFLLGDTNRTGAAVRLPVDAYYKDLKLVIEYREQQHTEPIKFFDKPDRMTISGVHRGEQRRIYDERRRALIPKNNLILIEISYSDFNYDNQKKIIRSTNHDEKVLRRILQAVIKGGNE